MPPPKRILRLILISGTTGALALILGASLVLGQGPVYLQDVRQCEQPTNIDYDHGTPLQYSVYFKVERNLSWLGNDEYEASIGVSEDFGHVVVTLTLGTQDISEVECEWLTDSVEIIEANGIRHAVPASEFTNGR